MIKCGCTHVGTRVCVHKECEESLTHTVWCHRYTLTDRIQHQKWCKEKEQHSAIRHVLTVLLEGERPKDADSTASAVRLTFDCVCVRKSCSQTTAAAQSNWSGSELPPDPLTNINTHVSVSYKKTLWFLLLLKEENFVIIMFQHEKRPLIGAKISIFPQINKENKCCINSSVNPHPLEVHAKWIGSTENSIFFTCRQHDM